MCGRRSLKTCWHDIRNGGKGQISSPSATNDQAEQQQRYKAERRVFGVPGFCPFGIILAPARLQRIEAPDPIAAEIAQSRQDPEGDAAEDKDAVTH